MNSSPKQVSDDFFLSPEVLLRDGPRGVYDLPAGRLPVGRGNLNSAGLVFSSNLVEENIKSYRELSLRKGGGGDTDLFLPLAAC